MRQILLPRLRLRREGGDGSPSVNSIFVSVSLSKILHCYMPDKPVYILGIESSCDDTSAAVIHNDKILANIVAGQDVHRRYGGVVPELASRSHQANIVPVTELALSSANITKKDLTAIAFTRGPGLLGSLLVGTSFAKGMALGLGIPLIDVHHMQAHVLAHFIEGSNIVEGQGRPAFPFLCLTVSGGHTQIVLVKGHLEMEVIGSTLDDAAGEAFDKVAKLLGLPYPGGPVLDRLAAAGNPHRFPFPHPEIKGLDFSFSGLKTSVLYFLKSETASDPAFIENNLNDLCASFQHTVVSILVQKLVRASKEYRISNIALAGGVSANSELRTRLRETAAERNWKIFIPKPEYCTDNAAMIAMAGYYKYLKGDFAAQDVTASARINFGE